MFKEDSRCEVLGFPRKQGGHVADATGHRLSQFCEWVAEHYNGGWIGPSAAVPETMLGLMAEAHAAALVKIGHADPRPLTAPDDIAQRLRLPTPSTYARAVDTLGAEAEFCRQVLTREPFNGDACQQDILRDRTTLVPADVAAALGLSHPATFGAAVAAASNAA